MSIGEYMSRKTKHSIKRKVILGVAINISAILIITFSFNYYIVYNLIGEKFQVLWGDIFFLICIIFSSIYITNKSINHFLNPINQIIQGVKEIQEGNVKYRLEIKTNDEIEEIADVINNTADVMIEYQNTLKENLELAKEQSSKIFKVYRDVIYAVTQGKFNLLDFDEIQSIADEGKLCYEMKLEKPIEVEEARLLVAQFIKEDNFTSVNKMHIMLCVSEAATNVIKHAKCGKMQIRKFRGKMRIIFKDNGSGMDFERLPKMIFLKGFSTELSMGYGFSIINKFSSQIYLATSCNGTIIALDFNTPAVEGVI